MDEPELVTAVEEDMAPVLDPVCALEPGTVEGEDVEDVGLPGDVDVPLVGNTELLVKVIVFLCVDEEVDEIVVAFIVTVELLVIPPCEAVVLPAEVE